MIKFPSRKARGRTEPETISQYQNEVGIWNLFLMAFTVYGAGIVLLAAIVFNMLGM